MTTTTPQVPPPSGAVHVHDWETNSDGSVNRTFWGTIRQVGDMRLSIWGDQDDSGRVTDRVLVVDAGGATATQISDTTTMWMLAYHLMALADEIERLSGSESTIGS